MPYATIDISVITSSLVVLADILNGACNKNGESGHLCAKTFNFFPNIILAMSLSHTAFIILRQFVSLNFQDLFS